MKNQTYKNAALAALKSNWAPAVLAAVIFMVSTALYMVMNETATLFPKLSLTWHFIFFFGGVVVLAFLYSPLSVGVYTSLRDLLAGDTNVVGNMFKESFSPYLHIVWTQILRMLMTFMMTLLLIVPGIIFSLAYTMVPFVIQDHPEYSAVKTLEESRNMMFGHKWELFVLELSFLGWLLLCMLTLGIGLFWLCPYMCTAVASFYEDVKAQYETSKLE